MIILGGFLGHDLLYLSLSILVRICSTSCLSLISVLISNRKLLKTSLTPFIFNSYSSMPSLMYCSNSGPVGEESKSSKFCLILVHDFSGSTYKLIILSGITPSFSRASAWTLVRGKPSISQFEFSFSNSVIFFLTTSMTVSSSTIQIKKMNKYTFKNYWTQKRFYNVSFEFFLLLLDP